MEFYSFIRILRNIYSCVEKYMIYTLNLYFIETEWPYLITRAFCTQKCIPTKHGISFSEVVVIFKTSFYMQCYKCI